MCGNNEGCGLGDDLPQILMAKNEESQSTSEFCARVIVWEKLVYTHFTWHSNISL